ncbi:hypothetical protein LZ017_10065 [Pelomonas sp. CA6]|uniref:hypothetical protein n=1 Tax=Pelomonas sp. CA6 TaxID=2907999 RepID=UPI001F4C06EA|nr:hypothetical protein [Pelomonas sp. CA6]MCH7343724.1 hypothetical protein [Pelomonas sp. CA6]
MLQDWSSFFAPALQDRLTLLLNHVLSREPLAMARLVPHAGKRVNVHLAGWPGLLPAAPDLVLVISRAGLWERVDGADGTPADLRIEVDARNPAAMALASLAGENPKVQVQGDAQLAGEINWLTQNLRWDIEDDLAQLMGPAAAHQLGRVARAAAKALARLSAGAARLMPGGTPAA